MAESRLSLREVLSRAWIIPGVAALSLSLLAFLLLGWVDHRNLIHNKMVQLRVQSNLAARRISAELLLGSRGAVQTTSALLQRDLGVSSIEVVAQPTLCSQTQLSSADFCDGFLPHRLAVERRIPIVQTPTYLRITVESPSYWASLRPSLLLWSLGPILLIIGMGVWGLRSLLRTYVIHPVETLSTAAVSLQAAPAHWPHEFSKLLDELRTSFQKRDMAIVGQISSGVIHDLKTILHSSWTAAQLASEQPEGSEKRLKRLEAFLRAAEFNFPKMDALIQTTLDGAREIRVQKRPSSISSVWSQSHAMLADFAQRSGVRISVTSEDGHLALDPIQMERALANLLKNAIEAAAESAPGAREVHVAMSRKGGFFQISISDSGPGLGAAPEQILRSVRSTKPHGNGLGLVITRKIVEAHQGVLIAGHSSVLGGAQFEIHLPLEESHG